MFLERFRQEVVHKLTYAFNYYGIDISVKDIKILLDVKGGVAGKACGRRIHGQDEFILRFNPQGIEDHYDEMVRDTIPHEIAHIVCMIVPSLGINHNLGWKRVCIALGGSPNRCHSMNLKPARVTRLFKYITDGGYPIILKAGRHNKLQRGQVAGYVINATGASIHKEHFIGEIING